MRFLYLCVLVCLFNSCKEDAKVKQEVKLQEVIVQVKEVSQKDSTIVKTITFPSKDGLLITADEYKIKEEDISILLCHQAGFSRGEYKDTAIRLNELGYSVMAIDQRSGNIANDVFNETAKVAKEKGLPTTYLDARQDIEAAVDYVFANNGNESMLLVGSSYSASLALLIGNANAKVKAVAAFSPGEYFKGININSEIEGYTKPVFVTSSKKETEKLVVLVDNIDKEYLTHHTPSEKGIHGSRALWKSTVGTEAYWEAFKVFLEANN